MLTLACAMAVVLAATQDTVTVPRQPAPIIDGVIGPDEWHAAARFTLDHQTQPGDNVPPSQPTEVRLSYSDTHLYVAFIATDSPDGVRARVTRRDDIAGDDQVTLYLDTYNDRRRAFVFGFNPFGIQSDGMYTEGVTSGRNFDGNIDRTWDGQLESKGQLTATGFVVEVAIPFTTLRYPRGERPWGLHVERWIARDAERVSWRPISRSIASLLTQMGTLSGVTPKSSGPSYELIPTAVTSAVENAAVTDGERRLTARDGQFDAGLTGAWTITPNLTASGTVNPDYSQIESDVPQIDVNQRFPLRYAEKRPFFYEGAQFFRSPGAMNFFESRQIVDPNWGTKLTGKIGRNTVGVLASGDAAPGERVPPTAPGAGDQSAVLITRYQRDILQNSTIGGFVTDYRFAGERNSVVAVDGQIRKALNTVGFQASRSWSDNPAKGETSGFGTYLWYDFVGRHWRVFVNDQRTSADYDSKVAFIRRRGFAMQSTTLGYEFQSPTSSWWVRVRPFVVARRLETDEGLLDESYADPGFDIRLARDISIYTYYSFHQDAYQGREYPYQFFANNLTMNAFKKVTLATRLIVGEGVNFDPNQPMVGRALDLSATVTVKPVAALDSEFLVLNSQLKAPSEGHPVSVAPGALLFRQTIYRNRTNYQFTREHGVRGIAEYNTFSRQLSLSLLYSWAPRPATAIYVGYGDLQDRDPLDGERPRPGRDLQRVRRTLFTKVSYGFGR
jgi:hypothetical protein